MDILEQLKREIGESVTELILNALKQETPKMVKSAMNFVWTEEEAAEKLKVSGQTLAGYRKDGLISHTWIIPPSKWVDGKAMNGRPGYMDHHIWDFLLRHETKAGKQKLTFNQHIKFQKM